MTTSTYMRVFIFILFVFITGVILQTTIANEEQNHSHTNEDDIEFLEGHHYHQISPAVPTNVTAGNIEVLELFWYGCPHCFEFEKFLKTWKQEKAANVEFLRMPAVLNRNWAPHARAYYALETMGEVERLHPIIFEAIHVQGRKLRDVDSMARFLSQHGIDADDFKKAYDSFYVETKIKRSNQLVRQYGSNSVPAVIVNGKFRTTAGDAGGYDRLLQLVNYLAKQESNKIADTTSIK